MLHAWLWLVGCSGGDDPPPPKHTGDPDDTSAPADTDADTDTDTDTDTDSDTDTDTDTGTHPGCADYDLGSKTGPAVASGTTVDGSDDFAPSCAPTSAPDIAFTWQVPGSGCFEGTTLGSDFDTVLAVWDKCGGQELACSDDAGMLQSRVVLDLDGGEEIIWALDGFDGATGKWVLNIEAVPALIYDTDLGSTMGMVWEEPFAPLDRSTGSDCGENTGLDTILQWRAPGDATYTFDLSQSDFDTVLSLLTVPCGTELSCDDDGGEGTTSLLERELVADEVMFLRVAGYHDGESGDAALQITADQEVSCGDGVDDDEDGDIDCKDSDCDKSKDCTEAPDKKP